MTIPSIPLVGSRRAFSILCKLPGVFVDPSLHALMESDDFQKRALDWAFGIADGVIAHGAAGIHVMNFGAPLDLMETFLKELPERAASGRTTHSQSFPIGTPFL